MHRGRCREHITVLPAHANGIVNALLRRCARDPLGDGAAALPARM
tara:strand:- start:153 stop:287 length:135 start_codon:yes stop_codon:yes gene_type:complete